VKLEVGETSSGLCPMAVVGSTDVKLSGSAACELVYTQIG
jgi:hypothetical protein